MSFLFDPESPFINKLNKIVDLIILGVLFVITSIPIFTIGASLSALYSITLNMAEDTEGSIIKSYFSAYSKHFAISTKAFLIMLILGIFFLLDLIMICEMVGIIKQILLTILFLFAILYAITFSYIFPVICRSNYNIRTLLKNSLVLAVSNIFPTTLIITPLTFLPILLPLMNTELYIEYLPFFLILLPGTTAYVNSKFLLSIFKTRLKTLF